MTDGADNRGPRPEWRELEIVTVEGSDLAVRIQTTVSGRPAYSRELGVVRDSRFLRHIRDWIDTQNGVVTVRPFDDAAAARVQAAATEAIRKHAQEREDEWQKGRRQEPRAVDRPNGAKKPGQGSKRRRDRDDERWS